MELMIADDSGLFWIWRGIWFVSCVLDEEGLKTEFLARPPKIKPNKSWNLATNRILETHRAYG